MKNCYVLLMALLLNLDLRAQNAQLIKNEEPSEPMQIYFYKAVPDSVTNRFVASELQSLSAFFMITVNYYFVDTLQVVSKDLVLPDFDANNVFVNSKLMEGANEGGSPINTINLMAHQYAGLIIKKYKLAIPSEVSFLLSDYIAGYYMSCRYKTDNIEYVKTDIFLETDVDSGISKDVRKAAFKQGYNEFINNYKKRRPFTLHDLIQAGLDFTSEVL